MRCDVCGKFRSNLTPITVGISYSMGPVHAMICDPCRDDERTTDKYRVPTNESTRSS